MTTTSMTTVGNTIKPQLGCCYYPEHWPPTKWLDDAKQMVDLGLSLVRIGEFAWSQIEPQPQHYSWWWLDDAINTLGDAGLKVVLGTPSATPPRWMLERYPDMLAVDEQSRPRQFGSRRHYCFSHSGYRGVAAKMASILAERYANNPHISHWQIDNEYGCHNTTQSYSHAALLEFRLWLKAKYQSVENLNHCWGNRFWSMEYDSFDSIELPNLTVTEPNPIHALDFKAFSSDQVIRFNRAQVDAIKAFSNKPLIHNYMGREFDIDLYQLNNDLDIASWDSYPLGFLSDRSPMNEADKINFYQQGDPDLQAMHHDLYRSVGAGRWWVMEQQPGAVNWAPWNPAPLPNMVRLWTWEAIAHGAEAVCYFRWRQVPFAQEQMHAGLLNPDSSEAPGYSEARQCLKELATMGSVEQQQAMIAILFDFTSVWAWQVQPQGADFDYFHLVYDYYCSLRQLGLSIDFIDAKSATVEQLNSYQLVLIPSLMHWYDSLRKVVEETTTTLLIGPRSGSKNQYFSIPSNLAPDMLTLGCKVNYVESLMPSVVRQSKGGLAVCRWFETIEVSDENVTIEDTIEGNPLKPLWLSNDNLHYLSGWLKQPSMVKLLQSLCDRQGIATERLPKGLRVRHTASKQFIFNYNNHAVDYAGKSIEAAGVLWS